MPAGALADLRDKVARWDIDQTSPRAKRFFGMAAVAIAFTADLFWLAWFWRNGWDLEAFGKVPSGRRGNFFTDPTARAIERLVLLGLANLMMGAIAWYCLRAARKGRKGGHSDGHA